MIVQTSWHFRCPASTVWPLLCNSHMDASTTPLFELGVPHPVECRLPDGHGGVGSERECVSEQGVVHQRILVWEPERRLSFRMEDTDIYFLRFVKEIEETFDLVPDNDSGVKVTRTTQVTVKGRFQFLKCCLIYVGLKQVHRYVFRNWRRLANG
jgi:hypothetical protein